MRSRAEILSVTTTPLLLSEVSSIAVLRANAMGDHLVSEPALAALRVAAAPQARITLRARCFDLAVQRHGGGRHNNPMALSLGAVFTAGLQAHDAPTLDHNLAYQYWPHEVLRHLDVIEPIGARPLRTQPRFSALPGDLVASERACPSHGLPILVLHMVSTAPVSRRISWVRFSWVTACSVCTISLVGEPSPRRYCELCSDGAGGRGSGQQRGIAGRSGKTDDEQY